MDEKKLKEAFGKVKADITRLSQEIQSARQEIAQLKQILQLNTNPTHLQHPTDNPTHNPTHNFENYSLFPQNFHSSTGNEGVPTNKQTNKQHTNNKQLRQIFQASQAVNRFRQELKERFSSLTKQEFLVFSMLYMLEEELGKVSYKELAQRLGLTESSVRGYILQLQHKGIPILKEKINNRMVILRIDKGFRDLTSLKSLERMQFG